MWHIITINHTNTELVDVIDGGDDGVPQPSVWNSKHAWQAALPQPLTHNIRNDFHFKHSVSIVDLIIIFIFFELKWSVSFLNLREYDKLLWNSNTIQTTFYIILQWKPGTMGNAKWSPHDLHKPWLIIVNESLTGFDNMTGAQSSYSPHQSVMISNGLADIIKYVLCKNAILIQSSTDVKERVNTSW